MGTAPVVCPSALLCCPPSAPLWGRSAAGGAAARSAGGLLVGGGSPVCPCPRLPCTFVNYARKFTGVNGCGCLRLYSLPVRHEGAPCRKVVRQWDFSHCVRESTRVGACVGVFVCLWGVVPPVGVCALACALLAPRTPCARPSTLPPLPPSPPAKPRAGRQPPSPVLPRPRPPLGSLRCGGGGCSGRGRQPRSGLYQPCEGWAGTSYAPPRPKPGAGGNLVAPRGGVRCPPPMAHPICNTHLPCDHLTHARTRPHPHNARTAPAQRPHSVRCAGDSYKNVKKR